MPRKPKKTFSHAARTSALVIAITTLGCGRTPIAAPMPVIGNSTQAEPSASITGLYVNEHSVWVFYTGENTEVEAVDTLRITDVDGELLRVAIELSGPNEHSCSFDGQFAADTTAPLTWRYSSTVWEESESEMDDCEITLEHRDQGIFVTSEGCRGYCGAGLSIDAMFDYPPTSADPESKLSPGAND